MKLVLRGIGAAAVVFAALVLAAAAVCWVLSAGAGTTADRAAVVGGIGGAVGGIAAAIAAWMSARSARANDNSLRRLADIAESARRASARAVKPSMEVVVAELSIGAPIEVDVAVNEPWEANDVSLTVATTGRETTSSTYDRTMKPHVDHLGISTGELTSEEVAALADGEMTVLATVRYRDRDRVLTWTQETRRTARFNEPGLSPIEQVSFHLDDREA